MYSGLVEEGATKAGGERGPWSRESRGAERLERRRLVCPPGGGGVLERRGGGLGRGEVSLGVCAGARGRSAGRAS